ncbi:MAG: anaerobic ribonucleoside-triphosphate reductase activating protein [Spirochaetaceae bacterium]
MALEALGLLKSTLVDYPGEVAATLFTHGCNLSCPYCHNPRLVSGPVPEDFLTREQVMAYLHRRRGVLGGVCITGGEPTLHADLPELVSEIHELGLKVKIDTNGTLPERIAGLHADYFAMDVKAAPAHYERVGMSDAADRLRASMESIRASGAEYEFRTTVVPGIVFDEDVDEICEVLVPGDTYILAQYRAMLTLDPSFESVGPYPIATLEAMKDRCAARGVNVHVRAGK